MRQSNPDSIHKGPLLIDPLYILLAGIVMVIAAMVTGLFNLSDEQHANVTVILGGGGVIVMIIGWATMEVG